MQTPSAAFGTIRVAFENNVDTIFYLRSTSFASTSSSIATRSSPSPCIVKFLTSTNEIVKVVCQELDGFIVGVVVICCLRAKNIQAAQLGERASHGIDTAKIG